MVGTRARCLAAVLVTAAATLSACSSGSAATGGGQQATSAAPSAALTGPAAALPSGLPSDPGAADPVTTLSAGGSVPPDVADGDLDVVVRAAGVLQFLHCAGTGSPTVVVVPGLAVAHSSWSAPVGELAQHTRTCVYDRPGVGSAPARTSPLQVVDAGLNARELATLLTIAQQHAPYVLVGQGYGTLVARAFARLYPDSVRWLVLAGGAPARNGSQIFWTEAGHRVDIAASSRAAGRLPASTARLAVVVLPSDDPAAVAAALPGALPGVLVASGG